MRMRMEAWRNMLGLKQVLGAILMLAIVLCVTSCGSLQGASEASADAGAKAADTLIEEPVERVLDNLTLEQKVAQLFVVAPEDITGVTPTVAAGETTHEALSAYPVGGLIYFADNLVDPAQTTEMLKRTQGYSMDILGLPIFTCVDEEGGLVARIAANESFRVSDIGGARIIGETQDTELARADAAYVAGYLTDLGFNCDFAPVADVVGGSWSVMWDRSFGTDPDLVSRMVAAEVEGFVSKGCLCSLKHFPGIGFAEGDSETARIYSDHTLEQMDATELAPFKAGIAAGAPMVMVGHLFCTNLSGNHDSQDIPASLNPEIVDNLLRRQLGFEGIIITDALQMGAVDEAVCPVADQAVRAIEAGCDMVLLPADFKASYERLLQAVRSGEISEERIDASLARIISCKKELATQRR